MNDSSRGTYYYISVTHSILIVLIFYILITHIYRAKRGDFSSNSNMEKHDREHRHLVSSISDYTFLAFRATKEMIVTDLGADIYIKFYVKYNDNSDFVRTIVQLNEGKQCILRFTVKTKTTHLLEYRYVPDTTITDDIEFFQEIERYVKVDDPLPENAFATVQVVGANGKVYDTFEETSTIEVKINNDKYVNPPAPCVKR